MINPYMNSLYKKIINQVIKSGKRIKGKSGKIIDIGVIKRYLTEEDIKIERELKKKVEECFPGHCFYAEEENNNFINAQDVWVADPISGTHVFICGMPHYGIVISHIHKGRVQFSAIYDPSMNDIYYAFRDKGAYINGKKISINNGPPDKPRVILNLTLAWKNQTALKKLLIGLTEFEFYRVLGSHAINDSLVACGKYNGNVDLAKDSFPYFASSLMVNEAGGVFTNINGERDIGPNDRIFIGGDKKTYNKLIKLAQESTE
ncbi:MAG: inositol monophosphatase [Candidatus Omnitrophica bacterium]|nr:inositol monophosphatase [Candidatus Omnitrophota bacterium]